jgi:hypothetical protein
VNFSHGDLFDGRKYTSGLGIKKQQLNILNCCVGFVTKNIFRQAFEPICLDVL